jgi:hypothetical protein
MHRKLCGPYGWYECFEEEKDLLPLPGTTSLFLGRPNPSPVNVRAKLFMSSDKNRCEVNVGNNFLEIRKEDEKIKFTCFIMVDFCEPDAVRFTQKSESGTDWLTVA